MLLSLNPLVSIKENFLDDGMCNLLIESAKDIMKESTVIDGDGLASVNHDHRNSKSIALTVNEIGDLAIDIKHRIASLTGFHESQFEQIVVHKYSIGQEFKLHSDFFGESEDETFQKNIVERCKYGGNRISTVIVYLNDVEEGGQTWFPWLHLIIPPNKGTLVQFNYNYDDWLLNLKTQHHGLPVLKGEKWIFTIWIRERALDILDESFKRFKEESYYYDFIQDVEYKINVGPSEDRRELSLTIPGNDSPENALIVGVTGGMDSCLLLYLVALLNTHLLVPYKIVPVLVQNSKLDISENLESVNRIIQWIRLKTSQDVKNLQIIQSKANTANESIGEGLLACLNPRNLNATHFIPKIIYVGSNELPNDGDPRWQDLRFIRVKSDSELYLQPFWNLQKYHILDAIVKLELTPLLELIGQCGEGHRTLSEKCKYFPCNERRWSFQKLGLNTLGHKYFTQENDMETDKKGVEPKEGSITKKKTTTKVKNRHGPAPVVPPPSGYCFLKGSLVTMADGRKKVIEEVEAGELVLGAFGEINEVLALDRKILGSRYLYDINGQLVTTADHALVTSNGGFCAIDVEASCNDYGRYYNVVTKDYGVVKLWAHGFTSDRTEELVIGTELQTVHGSKKVESITKFKLPDSTLLFNLVCMGSHTYIVNDYAVTGWIREDDFDYDSWTTKNVDTITVETYNKIQFEVESV